MRTDLYDDLRRTEERHWWHRGKRALVADLLRRFAGARPRILDIGAGTGGNLAAWGAGGARAVGLDSSAEALAFCRGRGLRTLVQGDAARLPFADAAFDAATALDVLEHLDDDDAALRGIARALRPGGVLVVNVPAAPRLWSYWDEAAGHRRRYAARRLRARLEGAGLRVRLLSHTNALVLPAAAAVRAAKALRGRSGADAPSDFFPLPGPVEALLLLYLRAEAAVLARLPLPFGLSLVAVAERTGGRP